MFSQCFLKFIRFYKTVNFAPIITNSMSNICNKIEISFLTSGFLNTSKSLLIISNNHRYLINCGEGTQKLFLENGKKINNVKNIFLTSRSSKNISGLIGFALGSVELNNFELCLHGFKEGTDYLMLSKKIDGAICKIKYHEDLIFDDSTLKVNKFFYGNNEYAGYLFSTPKMRPKIDLEKCKSLGLQGSIIKSSRMKEFLTESMVTFSDNLTINSKDVLIEPPIPERFLVIECPSVDLIDEMSSTIPYEDFDNNEGVLKLVVHLTDKEVFNCIAYKQFVSRINSSIKCDQPPLHVVMDSSCSIPLSYSSYYMQSCLNNLFDGDIFPKLKLYDDYIDANRDRPEQIDVDVKSVVDDKSTYQVIYSEPFMQLSLNDKNVKTKRFATETWSNLKNLSGESIIQKAIHDNAMSPADYMLGKMEELKQVLDRTKESLGEVKDEMYPNVSFIGTSSATPSKYRNISAILIQAYVDKYVLFDCGEGTLDRIITMYGLEESNSVFRNLQMICISHDHLDHHSGLYSLLQYRQTLGDCQPCILVSPQNVFKFNDEVDKIFSTAYCSYNCEWLMMDLLQMEHNRFAQESYSRTALTNYEEKLNLSLKPVRVFHTSTSYGFVLTGKRDKSNDKNWKITYSGDRSPKFNGLVKEGMDSDILIHEATMDDGLEAMAERKRHSTVTQAINEGIKMKAKHIVLTHFSSRYPLVPPVNDKYDNVVQAFDFMRVNLHSLKYLHVLYPYLQYIFPTHWSTLLVERQKRMREAEKVDAKKRKLEF